MTKLLRIAFSLALMGVLFVWPLAWAADEFGGEEVLFYQPLDASAIELNVGAFDPGFAITEDAPEAKRIDQMRVEIATALGSPTDQSGKLTRVVFPPAEHLVKPDEAYPALRTSLRGGPKEITALYEKSVEGFALYDKRASQPIQAQFVWWLAKWVFLGCLIGALVFYGLMRWTAPDHSLPPKVHQRP